ncbi:MAG TPA: hypothetical protein VLF93_06810 [Candidatus Saccharimonadales bacterium]|nr:hypothetical protein [Candidatus Saccharimonadales bacterium]
MKKNWNTLILIVIMLILLLVPQFWLGHNQYHLGGDDSRVYLAQPLKWLKNIGFWPIVTIGIFSTGIPQQMYVPFLLVAGLIQKIFFFANLQAILYGLCLSFGFLSMYSFIREVIRSDEKLAFIVSVIGGLIYLFIPISYVTFFMNPVNYIFIIMLYPALLFFYFKALNTRNIRYLFVGALLSALLSISFSVIPYLYVFIIGVGLFLFCYLLFGLEKKLLIIRYALIYILFIFICNLFWIVPFFVSPFFGDNIVSSALSDKSITDNVNGILAGSVKYNIIDTVQGLTSRLLYFNVSFLKPIYQFGFLNLLFPILIFLGLLPTKISKEKKKLYIACLIPFLLLAYLQTVNVGSWGPRLFVYLVTMIPGFVSLRNFDFKVAPTFMIFYSLTISIALYVLLSSFRKRYIQVGVFALLCIALIYNAFPLISGQVISSSLSNTQNISRKVIIPDDYANFLSNVVPSWPSDRIVTMPFTFGSWSIFLDGKGGAYIGHPLTEVVGGRDSLGGRLSLVDINFPGLEVLIKNAFEYQNYDLLRSLFGFFDIGSVVYHPTVFAKDTPVDFLQGQLWDYQNGFTESKYQGFLNTLVKDPSSAKTTSYMAYHIPTSVLLPRIYTTDSAIAVTDVNAMLSELPFLRALDTKAFLTDQGTVSQNPPLAKFVSDNVTYTECIGCIPPMPPVIELPYVRVLPSSPFYAFIRWKENRSEKTALASGDLLTEVTFELDLAGKRLQEYRVLTDAKGDEFQRVMLLNQFDDRIGKTLNLIVAPTNGLNTRNDMLIQLDGYLTYYRKELESELSQTPEDDSTTTLLRTELARLAQKSSTVHSLIWTSDTHTSRYIVGVPVTGDYQTYVDGYVGNTSGLTLSIGQDQYKPQAVSIQQDGKMLLGTYHYTAGDTKIGLSLKDNPNLISTSTQSFGVGNDTEKDITLSDYDWKKTYNISFDAVVANVDDAVFQVAQDNDIVDGDNIPNRVITKRLNSASSTDHYTFTFTPNINSKKTTLEFIVRSRDNTHNAIQIKNLTVKQEVSPKIIIVNETQNVQPTPPTITFQKINPIRYEVHVTNAGKSPYMLVLSDAYNKGWRVYQENQSLMNNQGQFYTYLDGAVHELLPQNIMFSTKFLTLGKQIAADHHLKVNGYANAWYVTPADIGNQSDYTLVITYWPQIIFYGASFATVIGIVISAICLFAIYKK